MYWNYQTTRKFKGENKDRVTIIHSQVNEPFIPISFADALSRSKSNYAMFADGDDYWLPNKIKNAVEIILQTESKFGEDCPTMVHTDLTLVDENLKLINESMWNSQKLNPNRKSLNQVIMHSNACGNTFIFNKSLISLVLPITRECIMHDYWMTCVASAFGIIVHHKESQILYRQHSSNTCGGNQLDSKLVLAKIKSSKDIKKRLKDKEVFAKVFLERFRNSLHANEIEMLENLSKMSEMSWFKRRITIIRYGLFLNSLIRNIGLFIYW